MTLGGPLRNLILLGLRKLVCGICLLGLLVESSLVVAQDSDAELQAILVRDAPPEYKRLIDLGKVRFVHDDAKLKKVGKLALTEFRYNIQHQFRYRVSQPRNRSGEGVSYRVTGASKQIQFDMEHTIYVPSSFKPEEAWRGVLLQHEFDHVAISTDPRIEQLIRAYGKRSFNVTVTTDGAIPTSAQILDAIQESVSRDEKQIESCVQANYDALDRESNQGQQAIRDRKLFFEKLYSRENLEAAGIQVQDDIKRVVQSSKYQKLGSHYDLLIKP